MRRRQNPVTRWSAALFAHPAFAPLAVLGCFAAAAGGVIATNPTDNTGPSTCLFKMTTGFDCPGCGGTRAFYYLLTGNLPEAARHHVMAVFAAPFLVWMYLTWALPRLRRIRQWRLPTFHLTPNALTGFLIVWAVFFIARNLPWEPFTHFFV
ncbi:DUF2752 domain-containing protein [Glycomyces buryatensis]|uniref:DUF2752 domain-containing protein n=1 Tax=Glycomyces buryatensis TaxID=2570927 RepID=UPI001B3C1547|nr:DUF2752 domain-containing protein [Glycomyces buryatensis]